MTKPEIKITSNYGYQAILQNGVTVSVQWGYNTYSDNRWCPIKNLDDGRDTSKFDGKFKEAEVAAWDVCENWSELDEDDQVLGWQTPEEVQAVIVECGSWELGPEHYWSHWGKNMNVCRRLQRHL